MPESEPRPVATRPVAAAPSQPAASASQPFAMATMKPAT